MKNKIELRFLINELRVLIESLEDEKKELSQKQWNEIGNTFHVIAGAGHKKEKPIQQIARLISRHGGEPYQWQKIRSSSERASDKQPFSIHAYRNKDTGEIVNKKTKIRSHAKPRNPQKIKEILNNYQELIGKIDV